MPEVDQLVLSIGSTMWFGIIGLWCFRRIFSNLIVFLGIVTRFFTKMTHHIKSRLGADMVEVLVSSPI